MFEIKERSKLDMVRCFWPYQQKKTCAGVKITRQTIKYAYFVASIRKRYRLGIYEEQFGRK